MSPRGGHVGRTPAQRQEYIRTVIAEREASATDPDEPQLGLDATDVSATAQSERIGDVTPTRKPNRFVQEITGNPVLSLAGVVILALLGGIWWGSQELYSLKRELGEVTIRLALLADDRAAILREIEGVETRMRREAERNTSAIDALETVVTAVREAIRGR